MSYKHDDDAEGCLLFLVGAAFLFTVLLATCEQDPKIICAHQPVPTAFCMELVKKGKP